MATAQCAAVAIGNIVTLFTVPKTKLGKNLSVTIDNQGAAKHEISLRDDFDADPSVGTPAGSSQTIGIGQWSVGAGLTASIPADDLKKKEVRGALKCYADGAEPLCIITVDYDLE